MYLARRTLRAVLPHQVRAHSTAAGGCNCTPFTNTGVLLSPETKEPVSREVKVCHETHPRLEDLLSRNQEWVRTTNATDPDFFKHLGSGHHPKYLYIGCSDARVDPGRLLGLAPGSLF
eukprot:Sspe_Gene.65837::Locus_38925_Transcript_1_1_Confidence_1.000_Length_407::g.65837::m.65837/K01673/cynT, can; carbonic anhydrase